MLYQAHARDRKAWIALVCAGHPNPEVDPDGPSLHASSRLCKTRDAQLGGSAAASSDWTVAETQPSHTNSSPDQAFQLRHDKWKGTKHVWQSDFAYWAPEPVRAG